jgi:tetratricopeptide (TPR) repeat protein
MTLSRQKIHPCLLLCCFLFSLVCLARAQWTAEPDASKGDFDARWAMARALSYTNDPASLNKAALEYDRLLQQTNIHPYIMLESAQLDFRLGKYDSVMPRLEKALSLLPGYSPALQLAANYYSASGNFAEAEKYFQGADIKAGGKNISLRREWISARLASGDYYGAEELVRPLLAGKGESDEDLLRFAEILKAEQRYEEAEGVYRRRLADAAPPAQLYLGLADLKYREKKFSEALEWLAFCDAMHAVSPDYYILKIRCLAAGGKYEEAWNMCHGFREMAPASADPLLEMGFLALRQDRPDHSVAFFEAAQSRDPKRVEANYYSARDSVTNMAFLAGLTNGAGKSPMVLCQWGECYAAEGHFKMAIACYQAALRADRACLPAAKGAAFISAVDRQYNPAIEQYAGLVKEWPRNRSLLLGYARVLSWARNYDRSIEQYDRMLAVAPEDPLPVLEKARVALWAKSFRQSMDYYRALCSPPVDWQLALALQKILRAEPREKNQVNEWLSGKVEYLRGREGKDVYRETEAFLLEWPVVSAAWPRAQRNPVDKALIELYPQYLIQKNAVLEQSAKENLWHLRWRNAGRNLKALTSLTPGNEEAWFDLAQSQYALGLRKEAYQTYSHLLELDPLHQMAAEGARKIRIGGHPALEASYDYWYENGYGHLSQMARHESGIRAEAPIVKDYFVAVAGEQWQYRPNEVSQTWLAYGPTIQAGGVVNPWMKGEAAYRRQVFERNDVRNANSGHAALEGTLNDYLSLGLRAERQDHFANVYALKQGIQLDSAGAYPALKINRDVQVDGAAQWQSYTDDNSAQHHWLRGTGLLLQHPRELKLIFRGDYRNTSEKESEIWENGQLVDIVHPYWSPQHYFAGAAGLEWRHDLARDYFAGAKQNYYDLVCTFSMDTEDNPGAELGGEWRYDLTAHVAFRVAAMIHRSRKWDAEQLSLRLTGRF